jgi:soluble lytic murein transglycosylase-like protein
MQIMPETAAFITGDGQYKEAKNQNLLINPQRNVEIGEDYLKHLLKLEAVDNDLFGLAIAYNAGPGKLRRWKNQLPTDDPLLFIELLPASETRAFVERVMTNYWIYQMQMGIEPTTLKAEAQGDWPKVE